ncbi:MAG: 6-carboxytetrahydropterin synthase [Desulfovibrio sp.]|jgi:6-pyruvoyltetrahydropterin/6-carboxytetrahydropterin synthase|nr:6-carboxytetrahydropterin synthase [Desulfovibrio sp.]MBQ1845357.1 6-carboxytetrahydropterin synthase [Desulfovibrio sp.]MBQ2476416.1 6-carboxytetrahydropterin synthase [Desulfovibrio sp.]MBQ2517031.1 6-carboxytetrahydropterin synthase [Desulfovibrio sp.]MCR5169863.1 6-carboxytetrahydropterin synthase [Desulfovibrio sp.]
MISITREHVIAAAHRLFDYCGRCERLHGHNYRIRVTLTASAMNSLGMVVDFADVKKVLFGALDEAWDHRTLLFSEDPLCGHLQSVLDDDSLRPVPFNPTAENMAAHLGTALFPEAMARAGMEGVAVAAVTVYETDTSWATWSAE